MIPTLSDKRANQIAREFTKTTAQRVLDSSPGRIQGEDYRRFLMRNALYRAVVRLKEEGYEFKADTSYTRDQVKESYRGLFGPITNAPHGEDLDN